MAGDSFWDGVYRSRGFDQVPWEGRPPAKLEAWLGGLRKGRVLDLCSGSGTQAIYLASKGFEVHGIEISETAVGIAGRRCRDRGLGCTFSQGSIFDAKIAEGSYALVYDRGCYHHLGGRKGEYVNLAYNALEDKGYLFLFCFSPRNHFEKDVPIGEIYENFSEKFEVIEFGEELHVQPDDSKVWLHAVKMRKK